MSISPGEFVCFVGPSGCGKTTLLRAIAGLQEITDGKLTVNGRSALVFQEASLLPWRSVLRNVAYGLELKGVKRAEARAQASESIRLVGLSDFQSAFPAQLSGGMKQRVNLARALTVRPNILLMDEPFAALDAQTRELMQLEVMKIAAESNRATVFATHDITEAVYLADRVVVFTGRPARIRQIVRVPYDRPRPLTIKREHDFQSLVDQIWGLLDLPTE